MQRTVVLSFKHETQKGLIVFSTNVLLKMDGISTYLAHQPLVDTLKPLSKAYHDAYNAASNNDELLNIIKDKKMAELIKQLEVVAYAVDDAAKGDKEYIKGAGFDVRQDAQSLKELSMPANFVAVNLARNGSVILTWEPVPRRLNYTVEMRIAGEENWRTVGSPTATTLTIHDLTRGSHVEFRVRANGTRSIVSDWTRVIDVYVD